MSVRSGTVRIVGKRKGVERMRRVLIISKNLIGDALYTSCAMKAYLVLYPDTAFTVLTLQDHVTPIYSQFGLPIPVETDEAQVDVHEFDDCFDLGAGDAGKLADKVLREEHTALHIAQCFGRKMGVEVHDLRPTYRPVGSLQEERLRDAIFISPFSMSCSSRGPRRPGQPPNKMLPWSTWLLILRQLRALGSPVFCLG